MAGPSLALGVNAQGQDTLVGLNEQLLLLRTNLAALKTGGKADLSGLSSAAAEIKKFRGEFADSNAALRTSFAELAEAIRGGLTKAAVETESSGRKLRSAVSQERAQLQAEYEKMLADKRHFTEAELTVIKDAGVRLTAAHTSMLKATSLASRDNTSLLGGGESRNPLPPTAKDTEVEAAWAAYSKSTADSVAASKAAAWTRAESAANSEIAAAMLQADRGFTVIARESAARRIADAEASALAEARGIAAAEAHATAEILAARKAADLEYAAGLRASSELRQAAQLKAQQEDAAWASRAPKSDISSAWEKVEKDRAAQQAAVVKQSAQGFKAIEAAAAAERVAAHEASIAAEVAGIKAADAFANAEMLRQFEIRKAAAKAYADTQAEVAALRERDAKLDAAFAVANERAKARTLVGARAQLDQGLPVATVQRNFGPEATGIAQAASSLKVLQAELASAPGKTKIMTAALNDLHSAARGVASGFGAMFLTWGNIAPLLAGAALSNAFVQTVKLGSKVEQTLAIIKELGGNTVAEVGQVKASLLDLAASGPFGPREIAEAFKTLSLAGLDAKQQVTAIKDVLNFAVAGDLGIGKAAEALVTIGTAFKYSAESYNRVSDVIAKTAAVSVASVEGTAKAFATASPLAEQYGIALEDVAVQVALLSNIGIKNTAAGTSIRNFYQQILADTPKVKNALAQLKFDPRDAEGRVKDITTIVKELGASLDKLDLRSRQAAQAALSNERGNKDLSSVLAEFSKKVEVEQADGTKVIMSGLEAAKKAIADAAGFSAIAAANMSLTSANQIKGVFSALQGSLLTAFDSIEPAVLKVAVTLKQAFNSDEFKAGVQGLANTVANLTVFLVEHAQAIGGVVAAYIAYKGAMAGVAIATGLIAGVTTLTTAFTAMKAEVAATALVFPVLSLSTTEATAITVANTAATAGNTLAQEASAVATVSAGVAARGAATGFALLRAAMGPIAFILGGLVTLWAIYKTTTAGANVTAAEAAEITGKLQVEALEKEHKRLKDRNDMIEAGTEARKADMIVQQAQVLAELSAQQVKAKTDVQSQADAAKRQLTRAESFRGVAGVGPEGQFEVESSINAAAEEYRQKQAAVLDLERQQTAQLGAVRAAQKGIVDESERQEKRRLADAEAARKLGGTGTFTKAKPDTTAFSGAKKTFNDEEAAISKFYSDQQKLLDLSNKNKLISDSAYAYQSQQIAEAQYKAESDALRRYIAESESLIGQLRANNKGGKADAEIASQANLASKYKEQLNFLQAQAAIKKAGSDKKADESFDKEITKLNTSVTLAREQQQINQDNANLTEKQQAYRNAEVASLASTNEFLREKRTILSVLESELARASDKANGPTDDIYVAYLEKETATLRAQLNNFVAARNKDAASLGELAAANIQPNWEKMLNGFKNTLQQMDNAYNEIVEGFVTKGQDIFADIVKNGRVSLKSLLDLVQDVLIKQVYQSTIAPAFADAGKAVASVLGFNTNSKAGTVSGVDSAASNTTSAFSTLQTTGITPTTFSLEKMLSAIEAATTAMWRMSQSGGGGGSGFGSFFGNNRPGSDYSHEGNNYPAPDSGYVDTLGGTYAKGDVFSFAKGRAFTNQVFSQPTNFHFRNGGGFSQGEMGEAGPEAVMPLRRTANGSLGVAMMGGGSSANVSVSVHNYSDSKARVEETTKPDGSRAIRVIVDQAKKEVASDIQSGGLIASSVENQYGMNRANGLPRR